MKVSIKGINEQIISSDNKLSVKLEDVSKILSGIESFTVFAENPPPVSRLLLTVEGRTEKKEYTIDKVFTSNSFAVLIDGAQTQENLETLSNSLGFSINENFFKSRVINLANLAESDNSTLKNKLAALNNSVSIVPELLSKKAELEKTVQENKESIKNGLNE